MSLVYKNDVGTKIICNTLNTTIPITATIGLIIEKPSGALVTTGAFTFNFATGVATYSSVAGDLSESGEYRVQVNGTLVTGEILDSEIDTFYVYDDLS